MTFECMQTKTPTIFAKVHFLRSINKKIVLQSLFANFLDTVH